MSMTYDLTFFNTAINKMRELPNKVGKVVVNKSVLQIAVGSGGGKGLVQLTKKATETRIRKDLAKTVTVTSKRGKTHRIPLIIALAVKRLTKRGIRPMGFGGDIALRWRSQISQECEIILKKRIQSRAYIAAGWLHAARDMARHVPGNTLSRLNKGQHLPVRDDASAAESYAQAASNGRLMAGLYNTSRGAGIVCPASVIQEAINNETANLQKYLDRAMSRSLERAVRGFDPEDAYALVA